MILLAQWLLWYSWFPSPCSPTLRFGVKSTWTPSPAPQPKEAEPELPPWVNEPTTIAELQDKYNIEAKPSGRLPGTTLFVVSSKDRTGNVDSRQNQHQVENVWQWYHSGGDGCGKNQLPAKSWQQHQRVFGWLTIYSCDRKFWCVVGKPQSNRSTMLGISLGTVISTKENVEQRQEWKLFLASWMIESSGFAVLKKKQYLHHGSQLKLA